MDICIIGGGPAGTYCAYLLSKQCIKVDLYEKNKVIGTPVQCTGILSDHFLELMQPKDEFVLNTVDRTKIFSPDGNFVEANIKTNYVVCRKKFDKYLADMAKAEGTKIFLEHSFKKHTRKGKKVVVHIAHKNKTVKREYDLLIGADGPNSIVAKAEGLFANRKFLVGTQIEAKMKNNNVVEFYPYIGSYAWIVPVDKDTVRIGVAAYKNAPRLFREFAEKRLGKRYITLENQSGIIPIFDPKVKASSRNVFLIGDAATFNKATTGGGINQSLKSARILAACILLNKNYELEWKKALYGKLFMHLLMHHMMLKFKEKDWNDLIRTFNEPKMKKLLYEESRDNIIKMGFAVLFNNPGLLRYSKYFPIKKIIEGF